MTFEWLYDYIHFAARSRTNAAKGRKFVSHDQPCLYLLATSGVMSQNIWGGIIFARERSDQARGSVATERGKGVGGGCPPSHGREIFIFRLGNVQSGAYLRRKWRVSSQNALYPSILDIWDLSCWNIEKIIRKFVILLIITSKIFLYI